MLAVWLVCLSRFNVEWRRTFIPLRLMSEPTRRLDGGECGLSAQQWSLLLVSFLLGVACVFAVDRLLLSEQTPFGAVQAATATP